jgi:hypothetical protein
VDTWVVEMAQPLVTIPVLPAEAEAQQKSDSQPIPIRNKLPAVVAVEEIPETIFLDLLIQEVQAEMVAVNLAQQITMAAMVKIVLKPQLQPTSLRVPEVEPSVLRVLLLQAVEAFWDLQVLVQMVVTDQV